MIQTFARSVSPTLVLVLTLLWVVLNQTLAPAQFALGALLGTGLSWAGSTLRPVQARVRRLDVCVALFFIVLGDIIRSNFHVACIVMGLTGGRTIKAGFVDIPLDIKDPHGLAALAMIVTSTPGTVWVGLSPDKRWLRLHVLDLVDVESWQRIIKQRYESRLMRILE